MFRRLAGELHKRPSTQGWLEFAYLLELDDREQDRTDIGWEYADEDDYDRDIGKDRCRACGRLREEGFVGPEDAWGGRRYDDPCIRDLPGVVYACCGHGRVGACYVNRLHGPAAARLMRELGGNPPRAAFLLDPVTGGAA